ncbi:RNA polymerase sigma factor [Alienimonas sp. DA493]|uniref:RNA polymerase sigma factor n=1 Tax=Alienimonas sp. DA493 TaxID=3373605 RepID=UPI003754ECC4
MGNLPNPLDQLLATEREEALKAALASLPVEQQEAITTRFKIVGGNLGVAALAKKERVSRQAIDQRAGRGLATLKAQLREYQFHPTEDV